MVECKCGCGREAFEGAEFIGGHQKIWEENQQNRCGCGCGELVLWSRFVVGHHNRVPEYKERAREKNLGSKNPAYGKASSDETRKKRSESIKRKYSEDPEWKARRDGSVGEALKSPEVRQRLSESQQGREVSEETRRKISETNRRTWSDPEKREEHSKLMVEKMNLPGTKAKLEEICSSEEWSQKMSEQLKNVWKDPVQREQRLKKMDAVRHTEEYKQNLRANIRRGPNHPNWRDGSSFIKYDPEIVRIRKQVREFYNYTCMLCGITEAETMKSHDVHHVNYEKLDDRLSNLVPLCRSCHGRTMENRAYWQDFFVELVVSYQELTALASIS